jgi:hypothetical protein
MEPPMLVAGSNTRAFDDFQAVAQALHPDYR